MFLNFLHKACTTGSNFQKLSRYATNIILKTCDRSLYNSMLELPVMCIFQISGTSVLDIDAMILSNRCPLKVSFSSLSPLFGMLSSMAIPKTCPSRNSSGFPSRCTFIFHLGFKQIFTNEFLFLCTCISKGKNRAFEKV